MDQLHGHEGPQGQPLELGAILAEDPRRSPPSGTTEGSTKPALSESEGSTNPSPSGNQDPRMQNGRSSAVIRQALSGATDNQSSVVTGFQNISREYQKKASKEKTIYRFAGPTVAIIILGIVAILIDHYFPQGRFFLVILVFVIILTLAFSLWQIYMRCGRSTRVLAWKLRKASRYLHVCQVPENFIMRMLPELGPEATGVCHCRLAGSSGDGYGFFPSQSANINLCRKQMVISQDVDVNVFYDALVLSKVNLVQTEQPGFCWLRMDESDLVADSSVTSHPELPGSYLSGQKLSHKISSYLSNTVEYNYPAMTYSTQIEGPSGPFGFDVDLVFALNLPLWPAIAAEWPARPGRLLPQDIIDDILQQGCYLVHKHCLLPHGTEGHMEHELDWRITFAEAETHLFRFHASKEALKLSYVVIKFVIKYLSRKRKKDFPALKSYHLKTVFLWLAESNPKYDFYTIQGNAHLGDIFLLVLSEYEEA